LLHLLDCGRLLLLRILKELLVVLVNERVVDLARLLLVEEQVLQAEEVAHPAEDGEGLDALQRVEELLVEALLELPASDVDRQVIGEKALLKFKAGLHTLRDDLGLSRRALQLAEEHQFDQSLAHHVRVVIAVRLLHSLKAREPLRLLLCQVKQHLSNCEGRMVTKGTHGSQIR